MQSLRRALTSQSKRLGSLIFTKRHCSNEVVPASESVDRGSLVFSQEQRRQLEEVGRIEKIEVEVQGLIESTSLVMNKNISTPYDCCRHISLPLCHQSPLALINDSILWDMHRPLPDKCTLRFLSFRDKEPFSLNEAFWRTGSFVLGAVIKKAFKDEVGLSLWNFPEVMLKSGSFIYDAVLNICNWEPTMDELKVLSGEFLTFVHQNHRIERLDVKKSVAFEIFRENEYKLEDVKRIAAKSPNHLVTLYRVGDHVDICDGPLVGDTSFFGRCSVSSVHYLAEYVDFPLYRFQGIALPKGILLNSYAYGVIFARSQRLNEIKIPGIKDEIQPYDSKGLVPRNSHTKVDPDPTKFDM